MKERESLVPAYTSYSIFCEKLRSGDVGERVNASDECGSGSGVSGGCEMLSWLPCLCSRKSTLVAESWSCCNMSQTACDELCGQGSAGMSMSSGCFDYMVLCGICEPHDDSEAEMKSCGHLYSVQVCMPFRQSGLAHITEE